MSPLSIQCPCILERSISMPDSRSGPVTQSRPIRVQNSWASNRCMSYIAWEEACFLFQWTGSCQDNYHVQAENEVNIVKGRMKRWCETVLMIFFVSLIKPYLNPGRFRHMSQKPFFATPFWVGLPAPWKLNGSGLIQSFLRLVALNKLLYTTVLCKQQRPFANNKSRVKVTYYQLIWGPKIL